MIIKKLFQLFKCIRTEISQPLKPNLFVINVDEHKVELNVLISQ